MLKKLILGVASAFVMVGAANADTIIVNDGGDDAADTTAVTGILGAGNVGTISVVGSNPAAQFGTPGFFGGSVGNTDVSAADNSVAHQFTGFNATGITGATLVIGINEFLTGSVNDVLRLGLASSGATVGAALPVFGNVTTLAGGGSVITINLLANGFASALATGVFDVLITDDSNVDFIALNVTSAVPVPAALPLMASALMGGTIAMRRRRKQS